MEIKRICIYPKEAAQITGKSVETCRRLFREIRKKEEKEKGAMITIDEFSRFIGIEKEVVEAALNH